MKNQDTAKPRLNSRGKKIRLLKLLKIKSRHVKTSAISGCQTALENLRIKMLPANHSKKNLSRSSCSAHHYHRKIIKWGVFNQFGASILSIPFLLAQKCAHFLRVSLISTSISFHLPPLSLPPYLNNSPGAATSPGFYRTFIPPFAPSFLFISHFTLIHIKRSYPLNRLPPPEPVRDIHTTCWSWTKYEPQQFPVHFLDSAMKNCPDEKVS